LRDYWRILVQRRWVIYTCLIAVVSVTMILTFFTTPIYEAVTTIQIERQGPDILTFKDVVSAVPSSMAYLDFYQTPVPDPARAAAWSRSRWSGLISGPYPSS
jgi:uncharacterized protein involved in exopolysaccharide biosynthesis